MRREMHVMETQRSLVIVGIMENAAYSNLCTRFYMQGVSFVIKKGTNWGIMRLPRVGSHWS